MRSRSATAAQRTAPSESEDCWPKSTRSAPSRSSAFAKHAAGGDEVGARRAVVARRARRGRRPSRAPCAASRARGPGRARATTTSASPVASFTRNASSTAFTSNAFRAASPGAVEPLRGGVDPPRAAGLGDFLDTDCDLHPAANSTHAAAPVLLGNALLPRRGCAGHRRPATARSLCSPLRRPALAPARSPAACRTRSSSRSSARTTTRTTTATRGRRAGTRETTSSRPRSRRWSRPRPGGSSSTRPRLAPAACSTSTARAAPTYLYIHLNNDVTMANDNRGKCVAGRAAYWPGLKDGAQGRRRPGARLPWRLGRCRRHAAPPLRDPPERRRADEPVPAPEQGHASPLRGAPGSAVTLSLKGLVLAANGTR